MLTGLSVGFAFRTGLFNIGAEGQLMAGSTAATAVALWVQAPPGLHDHPRERPTWLPKHR
jgi:simple sugar transport system permease protein